MYGVGSKVNEPIFKNRVSPSSGSLMHPLLYVCWLWSGWRRVWFNDAYFGLAYTVARTVVCRL